MPSPPVICTPECHAKRVHLYLFYSVFLASLLLLALIHFVFFLSSRRKIKYEARDYATRKLEFVTLGISDLLPPPNDKDIPGESRSTPEDDNFQLELQRSVEGMSSPLEPSTSSAYNRILTMNGIGAVPLQRIDEESIIVPREPTPTNNYSSSSSNSSTHRGRSVGGALQEPVIVTVATVSALFQQQHDVTEPMDQQRSRSHSSESVSSVLDISDLVNSPGRSITTRNEAQDEETAINVGDWAPGGLHTKHQMLDVRMGGARGGFLKSHRGEQPLKGGVLSTDAIFPANEAGGIYDT